MNMNHKPRRTVRSSLVSRKYAYASIITSLIVGLLALEVSIPSVSSEIDSIIVPDNYAKIQWAIGNATSGATIFIHNGTYYEHFIIDKPLTLIGETRKNTIVDGNRTGTVIKVSSNNVVISGLTVRKSLRKTTTSHAGIAVSGHGCNITGNHLIDNKIGIFADISQNNRIAENTIENNDHGISLYHSSKVMVEANNLSKNTVGISLAYSSSNAIVKNRIANSSTGGHGVTLLSDSFNNTVSNNHITNNYHGMWLSNSFNNSIIENLIANNELLGVELADSTRNTFYHNTFTNNPKHVKSDGQPNIWDNDYSSGGNYWSDYENKYPSASRRGNSGMWNEPYIIEENNTDRYPLVNPYSENSIISPDNENSTYQPWINTIAIVTVVTIAAAVLLWKYKTSKKTKRKKRTRKTHSNKTTKTANLPH